MDDAKTKVLFLCTGNSARSQMAEGFLRHYAGEHFDVHSAGLQPKGLNPYAISVMAEVGIPIEGQESTHVEKYLGWVNFGYLVTVCGHAEENCPKTFLGVSNRLHWDDLEDPAAFVGSEAETMQVFRDVRDRINQHVRRFIAEQKGIVAG